MPKLLSALSATGDADQAFLAFDKFMQGLPAGIQLFSMLKANPHLLDLIARIHGNSPSTRAPDQSPAPHPRSVLDRSFFGPLPNDSELQAMERLNPSRAHLALDEPWIVPHLCPRTEFPSRCAHSVRNDDSGEAGLGYSNVADTALATIRSSVLQEIGTAPWHIPGAQSAIVAMGKLGGQEMTASSDLDLMLIYESTPDLSNGPRPVSPGQYYAKLTQRLIAAITSPTAEGILDDADMRLCSSGNKGPVAVSLDSFQSYQRDEAWTWEKMALTLRARRFGITEYHRESDRSDQDRTHFQARHEGRSDRYPQYAVTYAQGAKTNP